MLIIEIALGIVLAVVILACLPEILAGALVAIVGLFWLGLAAAVVWLIAANWPSSLYAGLAIAAVVAWLAPSIPTTGSINRR